MAVEVAVTKPSKFKIDCKKWCRGHMSGNSRLLNDSGNMCCLGFYSQACGVPKPLLLHRGSPTALKANGYIVPGMVDSDGWNSSLSSVLMSANDRYDAEATRMESIASLFKRIGVEVEFENPGCVPEEVDLA